MALSEATLETLAFLKERRVISVMTAPSAQLGNVRSLILLSQLYYWSQRDKIALQAQGWICKPLAEWSRETVLSQAYLTRAIEHLGQLGAIKVWKEKPQRGMPWLKLDFPAVKALCQGGAATTVIPTNLLADADKREQLFGRAIPYFTRIAEFVGDAQLGFFISRCVYWQELLEARNRLRDDSPYWGWSAADWMADTGMSRAQLRHAMKRSVELKFLKVQDATGRIPRLHVDMRQLRIALAKNGPELPLITTQPGQEIANARRLQCGQRKTRENPPNNSDISLPSAKRTGAELPTITTQASQEITNARRLQCGQCKTRENPPNNSDTPPQTRHPEQPCIAQSAPCLPPDTPDLANKEGGFSQFSPGFSQKNDGFSQSTRARTLGLRNYSTTTTTPSASGETDASNPDTGVVVGEAEISPPLLYPPNTEPDEAVLLATILSQAMPHRRQSLLDELAGRLLSGSCIRNRVSYLRALVERDTAACGSLVLEYEYLARRSRQRQAAYRTSSPTQPTEPDSLHRGSAHQLNALWSQLRRPCAGVAS